MIEHDISLEYEIVINSKLIDFPLFIAISIFAIDEIKLLIL